MEEEKGVRYDARKLAVEVLRKWQALIVITLLVAVIIWCGFFKEGGGGGGEGEGGQRRGEGASVEEGRTGKEEEGLEGGAEMKETW